MLPRLMLARAAAPHSGATRTRRRERYEGSCLTKLAIRRVSRSQATENCLSTREMWRGACKKRLISPKIKS
jgi:hypothetical protein